MLLLLVVKGYFTDGLFQAHRDLTVVGDARSSTLGIFIEAHFLVIYDTINIVPGPERVQQRKKYQGSVLTLAERTYENIFTQTDYPLSKASLH